VLVIGHRGASALAPENTLAAFLLAIDLGADGVELDVQLSADGEPVVIHDRRVDRTSNARGHVSDFTVSELRSLDAGWRFTRGLKMRPRLRGRIRQLAGTRGMLYEQTPQPIQSLSSLLEQLSRVDLSRIYVEIKGSQSTRPALLARTLSIVGRLGLEKAVTLLSFDHSIVGRAKQEAPGLRTAITIPGSNKRLPTARSIIRAAQAAQADEVAVHYSIARPTVVRALHQHDLEISAWTVNRKIVMKRLLSIGVDSIMTNHVDRLKSVMHNGEWPRADTGPLAVDSKR